MTDISPPPAPPPQQAPASQAPSPQASPTQPAALKTTDAPDAPNAQARLAQSVADAYTLLDFACRRGGRPPPALSQTLVEAFQTVSSGQRLGSAQESAFWDAFAAIIQEVQPVTVESILFTMPPPAPDTFARRSGALSRAFSPSSPAARVLRRYLFGALITLLALLALQMDWAIGTFIYNDAYTVHGHVVQAQTALDQARTAARPLSGTRAADAADERVEAAQKRLDQDKEWLDVTTERLTWWNVQIAAHLPALDMVLDTAPGPAADRTVIDPVRHMRLEITRTELTLQILSHYMLVTLFALMGTLTQTLRAVSRQITDVSLTANDLNRVRTRMILGVISGVCMAWLYIIATNAPDGASGANRLPIDPMSFLGAFAPWAVAFVSGYSVEMFFLLLERLIALLTAKIKTALPQPGQTPIQTPAQTSAPGGQAPHPPPAGSG